MSNVTYEECLREAMVELREQLELDQTECGKKFHRRDDVRQYLRDVFVPMYVRYLMLFRKLESCYDQILQPQKRQDVRVVLDATIGRMLEVKRHIVRDCGDFASCDDVLVDLKVTPDVLEVPIPKYFVEERKRELDDRKKLFEQFAQTYPHAHQQEAAEADDDDTRPKDMQEAIRILQCNERGRQGRLRAKFMKEIRDQEDRERKVLAEGQLDADPQDSATKIQKHFKGYLDRKKCRDMRRQELEFLGMAESDDLRTRLQAQKEKLEKTLQRRKLAQQQNWQQLQADRVQLRQDLKDQEGGQMMEELHDKLLERIIKAKCDEKANQDAEGQPQGRAWNDFPAVEDGGSLNPEWLQMGEESAADAVQTEQGKDKGPAGKKKEGKKADGGKKGKKGADDDEDQGFLIEESKFFPRMHEGTDRYSSVWQEKFDPTDFFQKYDQELLRTEIKEGPGGLDAELRGYVDALVRVEIRNLEMTCLPPKKKGKGKKDKKKDKKGKEGKKGKGAEASDVKSQDPYNLCRELYWLKLLPPVPDVKVSDYIGAHNLLGKVEEDTLTQPAQSDANAELAEQWEDLLNKWRECVDTEVGKMIQKQIGMDFDNFEELYKNMWKMGYPSTAASMVFEPSMAQVRQAVTEYCILPLGSQTIFDLVTTSLHRDDDSKQTTGKKKGGGPLNGMTVLFFGAAKSGKTMLSHAVAAETGSLFFDLTPSGSAFRQYNQPASIKKVMEMVFRVATSWSPSVIYVEQMDLFFAKKKGKNKNGDLDKVVKSLKKELISNMKSLSPVDRVLVLGNMHVTEDLVTGKPADDAKRFQEMKDFFKVMIYFPHPDYSSRLLLWQKLVKKYGGPKATLPNDYDYELLAYMTNKCTSGMIAKAISSALTVRRVKRINQRGLRAEEFLAPLAQTRPVTEDEWRRYHEFAKLMPVGPGRRFNPNEGKDDDDGGDAKGKKGKKGKKGR